MPPKYSSVNLGISCQSLPKTLVDDGFKYASSFPLKSLYLYGIYGSGKTTFAYAVITQVMINLQRKGYFWPMWVSAKSFDNQLLQAIKADGGDEWIMEKYSETDLLYIDDIDKISPTARCASQLFEIINRRMDNNLPTIITSNCDVSDFGKLFDGSLSSRMRDVRYWDIMWFPDRDLRLEQTI